MSLSIVSHALLMSGKSPIMQLHCISKFIIKDNKFNEDIYINFELDHRVQIEQYLSGILYKK